MQKSLKPFTLSEKNHNWDEQWQSFQPVSFFKESYASINHTAWPLILHF